MYWLQQEYIEPKINIPKNTIIDTKVLVSNDGITWNRRYYAGPMNGTHYVWNDGRTSWTAEPYQKKSWEYMKLYE